MSTHAVPWSGQVKTFDAAAGTEAALEAASEWLELADRVDAVPFLRPEWLLSWWTAFGRGQLELFGVGDGHGLRAALPLVRRGRRFSSPTNWHTPLFGGVAETDRWMQRLADAVLAQRPRRLELDLLEAGGPTQEALAGSAERHHLWTASGTRQRAPFITLSGSWDDYQAGLGRNLRRNVRRYRRRLDDMGDVTFEVHDGTEALDDLLDEGLGLEAAGWKGASETAIDAHPATRGFYREFAMLAARRGWLRLGMLRLDRSTLAFDLCVEHGNVHYVLKTAYDENLGSLSPGMLLRHEMIRRAFDLGFSRYELLGGEESWKDDWTSEVHERVRVRALGSGPLGTLERFLRSSDLAPLRWLRQRATR